MSTPDSPDIRVGDAERERAASVLQDAAAEGRLTLDELDARLGQALGSRTRGELRSLLADLLGADDIDELLTGRQERARLARAQAGPGHSWEDPLVITAKWDNERRLGAWDVPPFLELNAVAADVKLNFTDARPLSLLIDVVIVGGAGDTVLILPSGWGADTSRLEKGMGGVKNQVEAKAAQGYPQLVIRGRGSLGTIKVRYPTGFDTWQLERHRTKSRPPKP